MRNTRTILLSLLLSAVSTASFGAQFIPVLQATLRGGESSLVGAKASTLATGNLLAIPVFRLSDREMLLPVFLLDVSSQQNAIEEETFFAQRATAVFKPMLTHKFSPEVSGKVRLEARESLNKETLDEQWFKGLYDSQQYSAGVEFNLDQFLGARPFTLGLDVLHQTYPNFHELGVTGGKNYYSKDFNGLKVNAGVDRVASSGDLKFSLDYALLAKAYTDSYVVKKDGTLDFDTLRSDTIHTLKAVGLALVGDDWVLGLEGSAILNSSNQTFFDQNVNASFPYYYDFNSVAFTPSVSHYFGPKADPKNVLTGRPHLDLGYQALFRQYVGRPVRWADGTYTLGMQADVEHNVKLDLVWPIQHNWALIGSGHYLAVQSNQQYQSGLLASYTLAGGSLGIQFRL